MINIGTKSQGEGERTKGNSKSRRTCILVAEDADQIMAKIMKLEGGGGQGDVERKTSSRCYKYYYK